MDNDGNNRNGFADRLKALRMQKGLSQKALAETANINRVQYNRYEKGETVPSTETLAKLADVLGVSVDYLFEGQQEDAAIANLEDRDLLALFEEIEKLPPEKKEAIKIILQSVVKENKHQQLAS